MDVILLALALATVVMCYCYLTRTYNYWRDQGIPYLKGILPGFGNALPLIFWRTSSSDFVQRIYESYPNSSMVGFYNKTTPTLIVRDPELIKTVMQTNFTSFSKNLLLLDTQMGSNSFLSLNPFFCNGERWVVTRKHMINAFSSRKLKILFGHVEQVCAKFTDFLDRRLSTRDNGVAEFELRDLVSRYTGEIAANAGYSVEGHCFEDEPSSDSFYAIGKEMFESTFSNVMKENLNFSLTEFNSFVFRMSYVPARVERFIRDVVNEALRLRRQENMRKGDFLQLMQDMESDERTNEGVLATYTFSFFTNIYDTSNSTISLAVYQLARHPRVQQRLRDEVNTVLARHGDRLTYESLKEMPYLHQVISESQRLRATVGFLGKICTETIELKGTDGLCCRVRPGMHILIPIGGLHNDPKYWTDPDCFDPDRFGEDRKTEIKKYTYLPFGDGPRMCIAWRMALLQAKAHLATLVRRYSLEVSPKTREPLKLLPGRFLTEIVGGLWVYIKRL